MDMASQPHIDQSLIQEILDLEWAMFQEVRGLDGPVPCQQDHSTFEIMRSSQLMSFDQATAESYLDDLRRARSSGRNLMTEKYARMMESTSPCECRGIGAVLPVLDLDTARLVERLSDQSIRWMEQAAERYPRISGRGRPIRAREDDRFTTSFETYNRAELATYSLKTLQLLENRYLSMAAVGVNPAEVILEHTMQGTVSPRWKRLKQLWRLVRSGETALEGQRRPLAQRPVRCWLSSTPGR
jgi:hypothetical protein